MIGCLLNLFKSNSSIKYLILQLFSCFGLFLLELSISSQFFSLHLMVILIIFVSVVNISIHLLKSESVFLFFLCLVVNVIYLEFFMSDDVVCVLSFRCKFLISYKMFLLDDILSIFFNSCGLQSFLLSEFSLQIGEKTSTADLNIHDFACFKPDAPSIEDVLHVFSDSIS